MSGSVVFDQKTDLNALPLPRLEGARGLSMTVYESLRRAISDGTLPSNYHLRENPLAAHFGVSTTPVREALRRLEREGLVAIRPNRGAIVQAFDLRGTMNLYEVRELIEVEAVRQAALAPERDFSRAESLLERLSRFPESTQATAAIGATKTGRTANAGVNGNRGNQGDGELLWPIDVAFHRAINEIGPNHLLADLAERTHRQIQAIRARASVVTTGKPGQSQTEHTALLEAIRERNPEHAEEIVRSHIRAVRDRVLPALRSSAGAG
jgi:DNA-binding GntR family transcriptional regulator